MRLLRKGGLLSVLLAFGMMLALIAMGITGEVPMGSISGSVRMAENGAPLPGSVITVSPVAVTEDSIEPRLVFSDKQGEFRLSTLPAGDYQIEASAKAHTLDRTFISVREGSVTALDLELKPKDPELRLYASQRVFMPDEKVEVEAHGFGKETKLEINVYRIDLDKFLKAGSFYGVLYSFTDNYYNGGQREDPGKVGKLVSSTEHRIENADAEGAFTDVVGLSQLKDGFYWIQCRMGGLERGAFVSVSRLAVVTKSSPGETLSYVTDLKTGDALPNVPISINDGDKWVPAGKSDSNGLLNINLGTKNRKILVLATLGDSQAVSGFGNYGDSGGDAEEKVDPNVTIFSYTDRPIYRPGDTVEFKGFVRRRKGAVYELPGSGVVACEIRDPQGDLANKFEVKLQPNGSFAGSFRSTEESATGDYSFSFRSLGGQGTQGFTLAAYRKPQFTVKVRWSKPRYSFGEKIRATVKCEYYFGGAVAGAKVNASLYKNQAWSFFDPSEAEEYETDQEYEGEGATGEYVDGKDAVTDGNGEAVFEFETKKDEKKDEDYYYPTDYEYTLNADVAEAGDQYFSGSGTTKVTQGTFKLNIDTGTYIVSPGQTVEATISAITHDGEKPRPNQDISVVYGVERWVRGKEAFGEIARVSARTGSDGTAKLPLRMAQAGSIKIKVSGRDELGNVVEDDQYLWVGSGGFEPTPTQADLELTLDKKLYMPGDTCKALITTKLTGGTALVTVEADKVLMAKVVKLDGQSALVDIPVQKGYLPRVTIAVALIQNKRFLETSEPLKIYIAARQMNLEVTSDRPQYLPGSTATYTIRSMGPDGKPVSADLSLAVVDESIYAIREDRTNPIKTFYPARYNRVETNYSFPELYLDGGDKGGEIPVRINFKDTAAWFPTVKTDGNGQATVKVQLPDNLTKWRATIVGLSDETDVGIAKSFSIVAKPLMVRLQGPRYMVKGDRQRVAAVVTNQSGADADVQVRFEANGLTTGDSLTRRIRVENGRSESVDWDLTAAHSGEARLVARAWVGNDLSDAVEQKVDIQPHARQVSSVEVSEVRGSVTVPITVRPDADPSVGRAVITVSPSLGASLYQSLDELIDFPYGCVEQTMSRFMPALVVSASLKQSAVIKPELQAILPEISKQSIARIENMQHSDGAWGWWEFDDSDEFMTAYVLDGLKRAEKLGYKVDPYMIERALAWAEKEAKAPKADSKPRDRAYLAYALALYGKPNQAAALLKNLNLANGVSPAVQAQAALAYHVIGGKAIETRNELVRRLHESVVEAPATAYWGYDAADDRYWYDNQNVYGAESTALPLMAIQAANPDDPLVPKAIRSLINGRRGDWWYSTRDTSFALLAMAPYLSREAKAADNSKLEVLVNGRSIRTLEWSTQNLGDPAPSISVPIRDLVQGRNNVEFRMTSGKIAYYSIELRQYAQAEMLGRLVNGGGFTVERTYHLYRPQRMEDGSFKLMPSDKPIKNIKSGELIYCKISITSDRDRNYIMVEDPVPSNCHVTLENPEDDWSWSEWYSSRQVFDNRVAFFIRNLPAGTQTITYLMRAESPGVTRALPTVAANMYNSDDRTSDAEYEIEVLR